MDNSKALVVINDVEIQKLFYEDKPVVTSKIIAAVHKISVKTVHDAFQRNKDRFTEGKHYFRLDYVEANKLPGSPAVSRNGVILFTQIGYLLLTKPMRDVKSWAVQEEMIDEEYRNRYDTEPHSEQRFVDGAQRQVKWYAEEDSAWIDPIVQSFMSSMARTSA